MTCREWQERIAGEDPGIADHLAACAECREFADGLRWTIAELQVAHAEDVAPADYAAVRARVMAELRPRRRWAWVWAAAGVAAMVVAGVSVQRRMQVEELALAPVMAVVPSAPAAPKVVPRPARRVRREEIVMKIETGDPDVVIYWIAEAKGEY